MIKWWQNGLESGKRLFSFHSRRHYPSTLEILRWAFDWQLIWASMPALELTTANGWSCRRRTLSLGMGVTCFTRPSTMASSTCRLCHYFYRITRLPPLLPWLEVANMGRNKLPAHFGLGPFKLHFLTQSFFSNVSRPCQRQCNPNDIAMTSSGVILSRHNKAPPEPQKRVFTSWVELKMPNIVHWTSLVKSVYWPFNQPCLFELIPWF